MKSRANIKGHPIHPILVTFPIAFLIGAFGFDIAFNVTHHASYWQTGRYLEIAGIVTALIAAVPGAIDYFFIVPPKSSGKKRATLHALVNIIMVLIFVAALFVRNKANMLPALLLEGAGVVLIFISGWLGGTLVYRNQIGVDPRYAGAGKWKEGYFNYSGGPVEVADADELKTDQMKLLHIGDKRIVLGKTETGYVAFDDRCTHRGASLAAGVMICGTVQCPWHGSQFDCSTGVVKAGPAAQGISVYTVHETGGKVYLDMKVQQTA